MNETLPSARETPPKRPTVRRGVRFALVGLVIGFAGLGVAAYRMSVESEEPPPPKRSEISDVLSDTIKKAADKLRKQPSGAPQPAVATWPTSRKLGLAASVCGFIGVVFGCFSWLAGEHRRWTWAALCVGIAALAWTHVVVAVSIAVAVAIGFWLLSVLA